MPNSRKVPEIFRSLRSRNFSLFFVGQLISRVGMWMQRTAVIWLIYSVTDSVLMVGVATFAEQFPSFVFSVRGGIIADRYNHYKVLMITQILSALQAIVLTIFAFADADNVTVILLLSVFLGIVNAYDVPVRQSMMHEIIEDEDDLPNAVALNSSLNNLARLLGPSLAGIVLGLWGANYCFLINAVSFIAVIGAIMAMRLPQYKHQALRTAAKTKHNFKEGWDYLIDHPELYSALLLAALSSFFVLPYVTLLPVYAKEIFKGGATLYGWLNSAIGIGAFLGTFYLAALKAASDFRKVLFYNSLVLSISLLLLAYVEYLPLTLFLIAVSGFSSMAISSITLTIIQGKSEVKFRGRMISFVAMALFGMLPLGSLLVGFLEPFWGTPNTILIQGIAGIAITVYYFKSTGKREQNLPKYK